MPQQKEKDMLRPTTFDGCHRHQVVSTPSKSCACGLCFSFVLKNNSSFFIHTIESLPRVTALFFGSIKNVVRLCKENAATFPSLASRSKNQPMAWHWRFKRNNESSYCYQSRRCRSLLPHRSYSNVGRPKFIVINLLSFLGSSVGVPFFVPQKLSPL